MIFPITSDAEVLMMDETDYSEHLLLTSLDEKQNDTSISQLSEATASLMDESDDSETEFLDQDKLGEIDPVKTAPEEIPSCARAVEDKKETDNKTENNSASTSNNNNDDNNNNKNDSDAEIPGKFDVLCGQSRICASHTGNRRFQIVLDIYAPKYDAATSKQEKMSLTKEIVACIGNSGGRFLKYKDGVWQEITTVTARDKVSHALRTKVASWKRQQAQKQQDGKPQRCNSMRAKPTHRRRSSNRRRRSASSVATNCSDILTSSFDAGDSASSSVMDELLKTQRAIFADFLNQNQEGSDKHPLKK